MALLEVGRVVKPHGLRGEVIVDLVTNRVERLGARAVLQTDGGPLEVAASRPHQGRWIVAFGGVHSREDAERIRGVILRAEALDEPGQLWVHHLIDAAVVDAAGAFFGWVDVVEANPASDLLVLDSGALVPLRFVAEERPALLVIAPPEGLVEPLAVPVAPVPPDRGWPARFDAEAARVRDALGPWVAAVDHVGSTAVPDLPAEPVLDVLVSLGRDAADDECARRLAAAGYRRAPEPWSAHAPDPVALFRRPRHPGPEARLIVTPSGSAAASAALAFRDLLRADHSVRTDYAAVKAGLAASSPDDRAAYAAAKAAFAARPR